MHLSHVCICFRRALLTSAALLFGIFSWNQLMTSAPPAKVEIAAQAAAATPVQVPAIGIPRHLTIERISLSAPVIPVGILPDGKLGVPENGNILGWYRDATRPGLEGTAVIDGHLRTAAGPGTFWTLNSVRIGDIIRVTDDAGVTHKFRIRETALYDVTNAPLQKIFGNEAGVHLTLITCAGTWNTALNHYDKRFVVFSDVVLPEPPPLRVTKR
ncbi:MAG: class F sortase [Candidatus Peribacteraceae bacterium]|nr:class F sortase [Candidatus Peribacteraceae bacterium]